ncbi:MAG: TonB family protein [Pseudomonadota bacterium]
MATNHEISLIVERPGQEPQAIKFNRDMILIGRLLACDVQIEDEAVGREHARIELTSEGAVKIVDLGTSAGTQVNGNRISKASLLSSGDKIQLGGASITVNFRMAAPVRPRVTRRKAASDAAWKAYEDPKNPVINIAQLWGDSVVAALRFGRNRRPLMHAIFFVLVVLGLQAWVLYAMYSGMPAKYSAGEIEPEKYAQFVSNGMVWIGIFFVLSDILVLLLAFDLFKRPRIEQCRSVRIGQTRRSDFFVSEDLVGRDDYELITTFEGKPTLNLANTNITGQVLVKGEVMAVEELKKTSLIREKFFLPLEVGMKARLHMGDLTFVMGLDPGLREPRGRTLSQVSVSVVAYFALAFFLHTLFMAAVMAAPDESSLDAFRQDTPKSLLTVVTAEKRKKKEEEKKEEEKLEKKEEKKEEKIELDKEELAEDPVPEEMKKEEKLKIEQVIIKKTTIIPKNKPPKVKRTLTRDTTKKKRRSLTSTAAKDAVRDKGALGALKNLNKGRLLGSKYGEEMDLGGKMLGDDGLADLGQDVFADLGGSADSDPFDLASADSGGGEVIPGRGEGPSFSASYGVDGGAIGGKSGPIVLGGASGLDELKKSRLSKKTKDATFKEKQVRIMPKDIDLGGSGKLDKETVKKYIRKQLAGIKWCYQKAYQRNNKIEGKVTVSFIISATGKVIKSQIANSTLGDKPLEDCIEAKVLQWRFPEPKGGIVKVKYPFVLRPQ